MIGGAVAIVVLLAIVAFQAGKLSRQEQPVIVMPVPGQPETQVPTLPGKRPEETATSAQNQRPADSRPATAQHADTRRNSDVVRVELPANVQSMLKDQFGLVPATEFGAPPPQTPSTGSTNWSSDVVATASPDKPAEAGGRKWGEAGTVIPFDDREGISVGPPGCPVIVSGMQVWDKHKRTITAELEGERERRGQSALSPDGRYFASAMKSPNQQETDVAVWDTSTGRRVLVAAGDPERFSDTILLSNTHLFVGGRLHDDLRVWNCETGASEKPISVPEGRLGDGKATISQDGQYLAVVADNRLIVVKTETGRQVAVMGNPGNMPHPHSGETIIIRDGKIVSSRNAIGSDATFVYAWMQSMEFSHDTEELAGVSTHPVPRVLCWNNRGKLVFDQPLYTERRAFWDNTLQWFPDRSAWLIENEIFDRTSGRVVLSVRGGFATDIHLFVYDDQHLLGTFPHAPDQLEVMEIPWDRIRRSLDELTQEGPAWLSPHTPVRIEFAVGAVRGDQQDVMNRIQTAMTERLARDGIPVSPTADTVFRLRFAEAVGDSLPIFERQSPFDFRGRDTGRTAREATGSLIVELMVPGNDAPIWRESLTGMSSRSFDEEITDQTIRDSMLASLQFQVQELNFPYFIPRSDDLLALPLIIE